MADPGYTVPTNMVVVSGSPLMYELKVKTATKVEPRRLATMDTTQGECKVCGATDGPVGVIGFEHTRPDYVTGHAITTAYTAGDFISILHGPDWVGTGILASGQNLTKGAKVKVAADGELTVATVATDHVIGILVEDMNATAAAKVVMVRWVL